MAITPEMIEERAAHLRQMATDMQKETDGQKIADMGKVFQGEAEGLADMCKAYEQQEYEKYPLEQRTYGPTVVKVQLTDEQREKVEEETGHRMTVVHLEEGRDVQEKFMPEENPDEVLRLAILKARNQQGAEERLADAQSQAGDAIGAIRATAQDPSLPPNPELQKLLDEKLADPEFLKGLDR